MSTLSELLPVEAIRLDAAAGDWREAVRVTGGLLAGTGAATDTYTAEMIENVEENGPYIVIAPGIAFAHARPSPAVLRNGMSWVRLAEPVEFGHESNDPVSLVVGLAAKDKSEHQSGMAALARVLADPATERALREAAGPEEVHTLLGGGAGTSGQPAQGAPGTAADSAAEPAESRSASAAGAAAGSGEGSGPRGLHKILTVCGNGVGTSLFLKNTLEGVLDRWNWSRYVTVEATDTISAKGKASEAVAVLTSREIARTLGDIGVPVKVVEDFTSAREVDGVLRDTYDV